VNKYYTIQTQGGGSIEDDLPDEFDEAIEFNQPPPAI
jgi:hypothetical protein